MSVRLVLGDAVVLARSACIAYNKFYAMPHFAGNHLGQAPSDLPSSGDCGEIESLVRQTGIG
jgi:hypothetical protein